VTVNVCAPIPASTVQEALALLRKAEEKCADLIEFRLDFLDTDVEFKNLISATKLAKIATNRSRREGGKFRGNESKRIDILLMAAEAGCEFVDIELATEDVQNIIRKIKRLGAQTIVSYHDFHATPDLSKLNDILKKQMKVGADICKIVVTAKRLQDNLRMLDFVSNSSKKTKVVSFAMGKLGVISRVLSPIYGASFTFASVERGAESAAGQLTIDEVKNIYKLMELE
jgi:3-dehydroquinate dehydratase type I